MNKERYTLTLRNELECDDGTIITLAAPIQVSIIKLPDDMTLFDDILDQLFTKLKMFYA